jgi:hypothetical protein
VATKPIEIDLRRDLPKVREQYAALTASLGRCSYTAPCAIGAMMSREQRTALDLEKLNNVSIATLIEDARVTVPEGQIDDLWALQSAFDGGNVSTFSSTIARLEAKYLTEQAA